MRVALFALLFVAIFAKHFPIVKTSKEAIKAWKQVGRAVSFFF
jgi:hypothetical protein